MAKRVVLRAQKSWFNATEKSCCFRKCIAPVSRREDFSSACFPLKDWAHSAPIYSKQLHLLLLALFLQAGCLQMSAIVCQQRSCSIFAIDGALADQFPCPDGSSRTIISDAAAAVKTRNLVLLFCRKRVRAAGTCQGH